jgi:hypothetical protein
MGLSGNMGLALDTMGGVGLVFSRPAGLPANRVGLDYGFSVGPYVTAYPHATIKDLDGTSGSFNLDFGAGGISFSSDALQIGLPGPGGIGKQFGYSLEVQTTTVIPLVKPY